MEVWEIRRPGVAPQLIAVVDGASRLQDVLKNAQKANHAKGYKVAAKFLDLPKVYLFFDKDAMHEFAKRNTLLTNRFYEAI